MRIAVIPARGGSKRIPRKNIKPFRGRPMIGWSIAAAFESGCFDRVIVSTDDEEIASVATACGAEVPFMRPPSLSDDHTPTIPVIAHAIEQLRTGASDVAAVCCIYATAPLLSANDLRRGYELLATSGCSYVFPAVSYPSPIQRAFRVNEEGMVQMFWPEQFNTRSQDLEPAYHDAGQFYWGRPDAWHGGTPIFTPDSRALIVPRYRVADIDSMEDWEQAELLAELLGSRTA